MVQNSPPFPHWWPRLTCPGRSTGAQESTWDSRHICCVTQQTCLLFHIAGMSAVGQSLHVCCVTHIRTLNIEGETNRWVMRKNVDRCQLISVCLHSFSIDIKGFWLMSTNCHWFRLHWCVSMFVDFDWFEWVLIYLNCFGEPTVGAYSMAHVGAHSGRLESGFADLESLNPRTCLEHT